MSGPFEFTRFDGRIKMCVRKDRVVGEDTETDEHIETPFDPPLYLSRPG